MINTPTPIGTASKDSARSCTEPNAHTASSPLFLTEMYCVPNLLVKDGNKFMTNYNLNKFNMKSIKWMKSWILYDFHKILIDSFLTRNKWTTDDIFDKLNESLEECKFCINLNILLLLISQIRFTVGALCCCQQTSWNIGRTSFIIFKKWMNGFRVNVARFTWPSWNILKMIFTGYLSGWAKRLATLGMVTCSPWKPRPPLSGPTFPLHLNGKRNK